MLEPLDLRQMEQKGLWDSLLGTAPVSTPTLCLPASNQRLEVGTVWKQEYNWWECCYCIRCIWVLARITWW